MIRIGAGVVGDFGPMNVLEGTTVGDVVNLLGYADELGFEVRRNGNKTFYLEPVEEKDTILILWPILGRAPIADSAQGITELQHFTAEAEELLLIDAYLAKPRKNERAAFWLSRRLVQASEIPKRLERCRISESMESPRP
jgi:hypothetical protein